MCHILLDFDVLHLFSIHPLIPMLAQAVSRIQCKSELARESSKPLRQTLTTFAAQGERNGAANLSNDSYKNTREQLCFICVSFCSWRETKQTQMSICCHLELPDTVTRRVLGKVSLPHTSAGIYNNV